MKESMTSMRDIMNNITVLEKNKTIIGTKTGNK